MEGKLIFWPVLVQVLLTYYLYVGMFRVRKSLIKSGEAKASEFRTYENEPVESRKWSRAVANQYELPTMFYVLCLASFALGYVDTVMLVLVWAFSIIKCVHVYLHTSANRLRYRQPVFSLAYLALGLAWIWFAIHLAGLV